MKIMRLADAKPYDAPGHFGMTPLRLHSAELSGGKHLTLGLSMFLPGGGAEFSKVPETMDMNLIYYVVQGEMTVTTETETFVLRAGDSVEWVPGDGRGIKNETNQPASMLVIVGK